MRWRSLGIAILAFSALAPRASQACSIVYAHRPDRSLIDSSSSVVIGRVESVRPLPENRGIPALEATVRTTVTLKGNPPSTFLLQRPTGDDEMDCPRHYPFLEPGAELLFFLAEIDGGEGDVIVLEHYPPRTLLFPDRAPPAAPR
jgi:hypothetical protein